MARKVIAEFDAIDGPFINKLNAIDRSVTRFEVGTLSAFGRVEKGMNGLLASAARLQNVSGIIAGGFGAQMAAQYIDQATRIRRALKEAGDESQEGFEKAFLAAQRSLSGFEGFAQGVQRMSKATGQAFEDSVRDMETLNKLLVLGGKSTQERMSTMIQFSQALQSGVLQGEELRSLRENAPIELIRAIAREAGGGIEDLKKLGEEGALTLEVMMRALQSLESEANVRMKNVTLTISEAATVLGNAGIVAVEGFDRGLGLSRATTAGLVSLGNILGSSAEAAESFGQAMQIAGAGFVAAFAGRKISGAIASQAAFSKSLRDTAASTIIAERAAAANVTKSQARVQALRAEVLALKLKGASEKSIAAAQSRLTAAQAGMTTATARYTAAVSAASMAQERLALSSRALAAAGSTVRAAWAFLGGWPGLLLTAGTAFFMLGNSAESAADRFERLTSGSDDAAGAADALRDVQTRLNEALSEAGSASDTSARRIIANTRQEMSAKRDLLALENQRLETLQSERNIELSRLVRERDGVDKPSTRVADILQRQMGGNAAFAGEEDRAAALTEAQREYAAEVAASDAKITELRANIALTAGTISENNALLSETAVRIGEAGAAGFEVRAGMQETAGATTEVVSKYGELLAKKKEEIALQQLINQYGENSAQVAEARAAAERSAYEEMARTEGVTGGLLESLMAAYDEAAALGAVDVSAGIDAAAAAAANLANNLGVSLGAAQAIMRLGYGGTKGGEVVLDPRDPRYNKAAADKARLLETMADLRTGAGATSPFDVSRIPVVSAGSFGGGGGRGGSGADLDKEALQFIESMMTAEERRAKQTKEVTELRAKLVAKYGEESEMVRQVDEAMQRMNETMEEGQSIQEQFWGTMSDYIAQSIDEWKGWGSFLKGLLASLVSQYGEDFFTALFTPGKQSGDGLGTQMGNLLTGQLHSGGGKGSRQGRSISAAAFIGAPRFHKGLMGLKSDEFTAILQDGETVLPKGMGIGGDRVTVVNNNDFRGVDNASREYVDGRLRQMQATIPDQAVAAIKSAQRKRRL